MQRTTRMICAAGCLLAVLGCGALSGCAGEQPAQIHTLTPEEQELAREKSLLMTELVTKNPETPESTGDTLCDLINRERAYWMQEPVSLSDDLMQAAAERVTELQTASPSSLHSRTDGTDWSTVLTEHQIRTDVCGEAVLTGSADASTAFQAIRLDMSQVEFLVDSSYAQFGYAHNDACDIWVLLMTN